MKVITGHIPHPSTLKPPHIFTETEKCLSCAYHTPCSPEEDEMTLCFYHEEQGPHQCHERKNGIACVGSMESLERLTDWRRDGKIQNKTTLMG